MSSIHLSQPQTERLRRLLRMEYTLSELAAEIGCARRVVECAVAAGCPHRKELNRLYVVGEAFAAWYRAAPAVRKIPLANDEAYCLRCRSARKMVETSSAPNSPGVELVRGRCAVCGAKVNRLRREVAE